MTADFLLLFLNQGRCMCVYVLIRISTSMLHIFEAVNIKAFAFSSTELCTFILSSCAKINLKG